MILIAYLHILLLKRIPNGFACFWNDPSQRLCWNWSRKQQLFICLSCRKTHMCGFQSIVAEMDLLISMFSLVMLGPMTDSKWRHMLWSILKLLNQSSFSSFSSARMSECEIFSRFISQSSIHFFFSFSLFLLRSLLKHLLWLSIKHLCPHGRAP